MTIALRSAIRSDVGLLRSNNQDSGFAGANLLLVADGMGGHAGGDIASSIAVAHLAPLDAEAHGPDDVLRELTKATLAARDEMIDMAKSEPRLATMGTTVTALLRAGDRLAMLHIGDSRAYLLRDGELTQVTADHTFVQHLVDSGRITPEEAEVHPMRSVIARVLGDFDADADLSMREAHPGDRWLLCSDGLSGVVSHETMHEKLTELSDPEECVDELVELALRGGGPDNITVIVADVIDMDIEGSHPVSEGAPVTVVGAATRDRKARGESSDTPSAAKRAAALIPRRRADAEPASQKKRNWLRPIITAIAGMVFLAVALGATWYWTQQQYFVGEHAGQVAVFQGVPQQLGSWQLYTVVEVVGPEVDQLQGHARDLVDRTIGAGSQAEALEIAGELAQLTVDPGGDD